MGSAQRRGQQKDKGLYGTARAVQVTALPSGTTSIQVCPGLKRTG